jgi:hypothetical protein
MAVLLLPMVALAQNGYPRTRTHTVAGLPTIDIYVLGATAAQGPWTVTEGISFIELMSVLLPAGLGSVPEDIVRKATMDIYRSSDAGTQLVYSEDLRAVLRGEAPPPILQNLDTVVFENIEFRKKGRITFQSFMSYLGTTAGLVLLYLRLRSAA